MDLARLERAAYSLISRREHSTHELAQKLSKRGGAADDIQRVIAKLHASDLLDDARFARQYIRSNHLRFGDARLTHTLIQQYGVAGDTAAAALAAECTTSEAERAQTLYRKKYPTPADNARHKQQAARFLAARGFGSATIYAVIAGGGVDGCE